MGSDVMKTNSVLIGEADEFRIILTVDDAMVTIYDGEGSVRLTMPYDIWRRLKQPRYKELPVAQLNE
jgi:hypothetical protein